MASCCIWTDLNRGILSWWWCIDCSLYLLYRVFGQVDFIFPSSWEHNGIVLTHTILIAAICTSAHFFVAIHGVTSLLRWQQILIGIGVSLTSLLMQLAGHFMWEDFQAPPAISHGLLMAPLLEWHSLFYRCSCYGRQSKQQKIWEEVDAARARSKGQLLDEK